MIAVAARTWDMVHDPVLENSQTHDGLFRAVRMKYRDSRNIQWLQVVRK